MPGTCNLHDRQRRTNGWAVTGKAGEAQDGVRASSARCATTCNDYSHRLAAVWQRDLV